jgi:hypothetical protein
MVQLGHASSFGSSTSAKKPFEVSAAELGRLLQRLQQSTLHSDPVRERRLRTSEYERARLASVRQDYYVTRFIARSADFVVL